MQGPRDYYAGTHLKTVLRQAELVEPVMGEDEEAKPTLWERLRAFVSLAMFRPVRRRA